MELIMDISTVIGVCGSFLLLIWVIRSLVMIPVQMVTLQFLGKPVLAAARTAGL